MSTWQAVRATQAERVAIAAAEAERQAKLDAEARLQRALEELMREISVHYQSEVDYSVKSLSATLEPILIWFLGMGVLVLALGVFMPMWDLGRTTAH